MGNLQFYHCGLCQLGLPSKTSPLGNSIAVNRRERTVNHSFFKRMYALIYYHFTLFNRQRHDICRQFFIIDSYLDTETSVSKLCIITFIEVKIDERLFFAHSTFAFWKHGQFFICYIWLMKSSPKFANILKSQMKGIIQNEKFAPSNGQ